MCHGELSFGGGGRKGETGETGEIAVNWASRRTDLEAGVMIQAKLRLAMNLTLEINDSVQPELVPGVESWPGRIPERGRGTHRITASLLHIRPAIPWYPHACFTALQPDGYGPMHKVTSSRRQPAPSPAGTRSSIGAFADDHLSSG